MDPNALRFAFEESEGGMILNVFYAEEKAGFIHIADEIDMNGAMNPVVEKVELEAAVKGKGLGQLLYLAAAKEYLEKKGKLLRKSGLTTNDANLLWKRLVAKNLAREVPNVYGDVDVLMDRAVLESGVGRTAAEFVRERLKP